MFRFLHFCRLCVFGWAVLVTAVGTGVLVEAVRMRRARGGEGYATAWLQLMDDVGTLGPVTATNTAELAPAVATAIAPASDAPSLSTLSPPSNALPSSGKVDASNSVAVAAVPMGPASGGKTVLGDSLETPPTNGLKEVAQNPKESAVGEVSDAEDSTEETTEGTTEGLPVENAGDAPEPISEETIKKSPDGALEKAIKKTPEQTIKAPSGSTEATVGRSAGSAAGGIGESAAGSTVKNPGTITTQAKAGGNAEETSATSMKNPSIVQSGTTSAPFLTGGSTAPGANTAVRGTAIPSTRAVKPTLPGSGAKGERFEGLSLTPEDTARNLSAAIQRNREKKKTRSELEKKKREQLAHVEKDRALLRDSLLWTENVLRSVATLARKADAVAEGVTDEFFKDVHFSAIPLEDLPLALQPNISAANMAATVNCPVHCDPTICDNTPSGLTQCLKVDYETSEDEAVGVETTSSPVVKRRHICLPFEDPAEYRCPSQSDRCAMVSPRKRVMLRLPVSTPSANKFNKLVVEGYNMHPCIKILLLPAGVRCDRETVPSMVAATGRVMGFGGTTAFPEVYDGRKAVFSKVEILEPGTFDVCLLQFAKKPKGKAESATTSGAEGVVVLTTTSIGKVVAVPTSEWTTVAPTGATTGAFSVSTRGPNGGEPLKTSKATKVA